MSPKSYLLRQPVTKAFPLSATERSEGSDSSYLFGQDPAHAMTDKDDWSIWFLVRQELAVSTFSQTKASYLSSWVLVLELILEDR